MLRRKNILLFAVLFQFFFYGCTSSDTRGIELQIFKGDTFSFSQVEKGKGTILFFLSPECPLSQSYTLYINQLAENTAYNEYQIFGVIPSTYYTKEQIEEYIAEYNIQIPLLLDPDYQLVKHLGATITPEVFLLNTDASIQYHGAIDNWYVKLGERRQVITEHYLNKVLEAHLNGTEIEMTETKPVGCLIE